MKKYFPFARPVSRELASIPEDQIVIATKIRTIGAIFVGVVLLIAVLA